MHKYEHNLIIFVIMHWFAIARKWAECTLIYSLLSCLKRRFNFPSLFALLAEIKCASSTGTKDGLNLTHLKMSSKT